MYRSHSSETVVQPCLLFKDRRKCAVISNIVIIQCIVVFVGSATILQCVWSPDFDMLDYNKLVRIMYLYDSEACGHKLREARSMANLQFSNETNGLAVLPIKWKAAISTVSTRLSARTRNYIELSVIFHVIWMIQAIGVRVFTRSSTEIKVIKFTLTIFFYSSIAVLCFDLSMAIVYIAHIKQSLTKGMVLRYSGWSVKLELENYDEFAGWLPIVASICWMRGVFILALNFYCIKVIHFIRKKIRRREVKRNIVEGTNLAIPEPNSLLATNSAMLIYRNGERKPYVAREYYPQMF